MRLISLCGLLVLVTSPATNAMEMDKKTHIRRRETLTPLNGKLLVVSGLDGPLGIRMIRNSSGYIVDLGGVGGQMIPWLSRYFNFTYVPLQVQSVPLDPSGDKPGLLSFLGTGECDIVSTVAVTELRMSLADFTHTSLYTPVCFLIPQPKSAADVFAIFYPFTISAWIGVMVSFVAVTLALFITTRCCPMFGMQTQETSDHGKKLEGRKQFTKLNIIGFVANLDSSRAIRIIGIRVVVGTWCLAVFILGNEYTSLMTSFLTAPNPQPLIKSVQELRNRTDLRLVTDKNSNVDTILSSATTGLNKELGDMLRSFPQSRCLKSDKCVEMVKEGKTVYTGGRDGFLFNAMRNDYRATGQCNLMIGNECFMQLQVAWALKKQSPYTNSINIGLMRMRQAGLTPRWYKQNQPDVRPCIQTKLSSLEELRIVPPLDTTSMFAAFVILGFGYLIALIVFVGEIIRSALDRA